MVNTNTNITFLNFDNPEISAYTLGFLWGDGYLREYKMKAHSIYYPFFSGTETDFYESYNIIKDFKIKKEWVVRTIKPNVHINKYGRTIISNPSLYAAMYDKSIGNWLNDMDFRNKSQITPTKVLTQIPVEYHCYFWRGLVDSDGCFSIKGKSVSYFSITSGYNYDWSELDKVMDSLMITRYNVRRVYVEKENSAYSCLNIRNCHDIQTFGNFIYDGIHFGLNRKYTIFKQIAERANDNSRKTSKYRGVCFDKRDKKWIAKTYVDKKAFLIGRFTEENDAALAVNEFRANKDLKIYNIIS